MLQNYENYAAFKFLIKTEKEQILKSILMSYLMLPIMVS